MHLDYLITDLALILIVAAIVTLLFKKINHDSAILRIYDPVFPDAGLMIFIQLEDQVPAPGGR